MSPNAVARVIVVNYNGGALVERAVDSIVAQTVPVACSVVDNASSDDSVLRLGRKSGVTLLRLDRNVGFGAGANHGAAAATAPWLAFLNSDAIAQPNWIERTTNWMEREGVDCASSLIGAGSSLYFAGGRWVSSRGSVIEEREFTNRPTDWISGCAFVIRRDLFERLEGFDEGYFLYSEDVDLSLRARAMGATLRVFPERLVEHPKHGASAALLGDSVKRRIAFRSRGRLIARHVRSRARVLAIFVQGFAVPLAAGYRAGEIWALFLALLDGYREARNESSAACAR